MGCARHGHRGRAAAAGVSVDFRSRVRGSGPRVGLGRSARAWRRLGSTQVPWNQRLTTMDNPQEAPTGQGSSTPRAGHTVVGAHTEEARTRPVPVRRFHNAAPQRTTRKPNPARSRARACYPGGLQLASTSPTHRNRTLSATSMFITAAVSSCVGAPLALC